MILSPRMPSVLLPAVAALLAFPSDAVAGPSGDAVAILLAFAYLVVFCLVSGVGAFAVSRIARRLGRSPWPWGLAQFLCCLFCPRIPGFEMVLSPWAIAAMFVPWLPFAPILLLALVETLPLAPRGSKHEGSAARGL